MLSIRSAAASVALLALMFGATAARACDDRFPFTCPVTETSAGPEAKEPAAQTQTKRAARPSPAAKSAEQKAAPSAAKKSSARQKQFESSGAGTESELLTGAVPLPRDNPRPRMAVQPQQKEVVSVAAQDQLNEIDLSADRLLVDPSPAAPPAVQVAPAFPAEPTANIPAPAASPPQAISVKTTTILRTTPDVQPVSSRTLVPAAAEAPPAVLPAPPAPVTTGSNRAEVASAPRSDNSDAPEMSWLRRIFLGLGGILAVASAIRMFIG
jgi:hypothetical protein